MTHSVMRTEHMATHQRLELRHGQGLKMTPQLRQAIKLLQLSNSDLSTFISEQVEANPLIHCTDHDHHNVADTASEHSLAAATAPVAASPEHAGSMPGSAMSADTRRAEPPIKLIGSADGDSPSFRTGLTKGRSTATTVPARDLAADLPQPMNLRSHLYQELATHAFAPSEQLIAAILIDDTDDAGYCKADLTEVASHLGTSIKAVKEVLNKCQSFAPVGIMAQDLADCLRLQLHERGRYDSAIAMLLDNLALIGRHDLAGLSKICGVDEKRIVGMIAELRQLNPKPGSCFSIDATIPIIPDIIMSELEAGLYAVELNTECLPRVLMDRAYYAEITAHQINKHERDFIANCAENASWLIKALDQRARTILTVSREVVRQQDAFFSDGVLHLKPLTLRQIADQVGLHESTVSRATANKHIATPRGVFALKYFFSSKLPAYNGQQAQSARSIRHQIRALIDNEGVKALSDGTIATILNNRGTDIARRTVAKYRASMRLPSSTERNQKLGTYCK